MTVGVAAVAVTAVPVAAPVTVAAVPVAAPVAAMAMAATVSGPRVSTSDGRRRYQGRAGHRTTDEQRE